MNGARMASAAAAIRAAALFVFIWPGVVEADAVPVRFGGVAIDTSHLEETGDRRAPLLVIRIGLLSLASYVGRSDNGLPGLGNTDDLEGGGVVAAGSRILSSTHVLSALDARYSGAWYLPDIDERRVASISHHFAYWLRREMGL